MGFPGTTDIALNKLLKSLLALALACLPACTQAPALKPLRILFIGNSLTYVNDLPGALAAIAGADGRALAVSTRAVGGWTLAMHDADPDTNAMIRKGGWFAVVLQEQSIASVDNFRGFHDAAVSLGAKVKAAGARTLLYQNWPLKGHPERTGEYRDAFESVARELGARRVPAGDAWNLVLQDSPGRWAGLYDDDRHPTVQGTYLTACVFYGVLFQASPTHQDPVFGLGPEDSAYLQAKAWQAVQDLSPTAQTALPDALERPPEAGCNVRSRSRSSAG